MSNLSEIGASKVGASVSLIANPVLVVEVRAPHLRYVVECLDKDGNPKWSEDFENLVTTGGKDFLLDTFFAGSAYTAAWYLGLLNGTPAATDTAATHAGWTEANPYTGNRPALAWSAASAGSKAATTVSYSITAAGPTTVTGAFTASANTGTTGTLYSAGNFSASRSVVAGDTLNVSLTLSV